MTVLRNIILTIFIFGNIAGCSQTLEMTIVSVNDHDIVAEVADTDQARQRGLGGRISLAENEGMLFLFSDQKIRSFWMKEMNFPIDIIWLKDNQVVGWEENVPHPDPNQAIADLPSYYSPQPVNQVLELQAGMAHRLNLQIGDIIKIN